MSLKTVCNRLLGNTHETALLYTFVMSEHLYVGIVYIGCVYYIMMSIEGRYIVITTDFFPVKEVINF